MLECVGEGGAGLEEGPVTCVGSSGATLEGYITVAAGGEVQSVSVTTRGPVVAGSWQVGDNFSIEQAGASAAGEGVVVGLTAGLSGKRPKHRHLQGDVIQVKDLSPTWVGASSRRPHHIARERQVSCHCAAACAFRVVELYTYSSVTKGEVQITIYNQDHHSNEAATKAPAVTRPMRRDINGLQAKGHAPMAIERLLRATYDEGDPLGENTPSVKQIKMVVKAQKEKPRGAGGVTMCDTEQLEHVMEKVLKPGVSTASGEMILWTKPDLTVGRKDPGGSYTWLWLLNSEDARERMRKGGEPVVDDAEEKQVPGSSLWHLAIVEDALPNPNRPGCPLSETTRPLAIGSTDLQGAEMLAESILAVEMYRDCADDGCSNPKRLVEAEDGSYRLVRGCNHAPVAPFARHRADLYGARRASMSIINAALRVMLAKHGVVLAPGNPSVLDVCDTHDLMAQYSTVFAKKWIVLEGVTPSQGGFGLGLLSKACKKCPFENMLEAVSASTPASPFQIGLSPNLWQLSSRATTPGLHQPPPCRQLLRGCCGLPTRSLNGLKPGRRAVSKRPKFDHFVAVVLNATIAGTQTVCPNCSLSARSLIACSRTTIARGTALRTART